VQQNAHAVQAELDRALSVLLREAVASTGAGRTDTGVHARQLMVHFETRAEIRPGFVHSLNGLLPYDIAVNALLLPLNQDLHARFDAIHRAYVYQIVRRKSPLEHEFALWVRQELDVAKMSDAAALLLRYDDFASFCKAHGDNQTTLCRMDRAEWIYQGEMLQFHVQANRFLRGMVRALVGTLLLVGSGKMDTAEFQRVIEAKDRSQAGPNADPRGLFLSEVCYPPGSFEVIERI
jgi:tRNA pseudouridine38-40 synthase